MIGLLSALLLGGEVVALAPLPRGAVLTSEMVAAAPGTDLSRHIGQKLTRPVFAGQAIGPRDLAPPDLVVRQAPVILRYRAGTLTVDLPARAVGSGAVGDVVTVLAEGRRRPLRGIVAGPGLVEITR